MLISCASPPSCRLTRHTKELVSALGAAVSSPPGPHSASTGPLRPRLRPSEVTYGAPPLSARSAAAAKAGRPAGGGGGGGGRRRGKMADGVDHIDIYADVGEEFNQVGEGLGLGSTADADGAAAWTLIGVTAGREPGSAADREPGASGPRRCVCGVPLTPCSRASFLRAVERGAGPLCSRRHPPARSSLPQGGLTSHCWLRWRALPAELGRVCGAGRTGPPRPLPRRRPDWGGAKPCWPGARPSAASSIPALLLGFRFLPSLHFVSSCPRTVALMEGRIHSLLYPARRVSWAPLLALATGFGVVPGVPLPGAVG